MDTHTPCYTKSDEFRLEPDAPEDDDPRTEVEKRLSWLCSDWSDALVNDSYDEWHSVRMTIYGATQVLTFCGDRFEDQHALRDLAHIAFENSLECIRSGKYEGAPAQGRTA